MAANDVKKVYQDIIDEVCKSVREALSEEGYDDHTLQELRTLWLSKLESSKALEPQPVSAVDQATKREFRHPTAVDTNNKQSTGVKVNRLHPVSNTAVMNFNANHTPTMSQGILSAATTTTTIPTATTQFIRPNFPIRPTNPTNNIMKTTNQIDGANDEVIMKKKSSKKKIEVQFQVDGTGPPLGDDDDDEEDSEVEGNDVGDELDDDDDDDDNDEGKEDPNPLCSDDDISGDEDGQAELFDTENVVVCQYDRISRTKNKWRFILKSGVMNIEGRDYVFSKATGDADW